MTREDKIKADHLLQKLWGKEVENKYETITKEDFKLIQKVIWD